MLSSIWASALYLVLLPLYAQAHSSPPKPLRAISHPSTRSLQILPRTPSPHPPNAQLSKRSQPSLTAPDLRYSDSLRLIVNAFGESFHLHLRPNEHLVHSAARINHYSTAADGSSVLTRTVPLTRESVRAYMGEVVTAEATEARMVEDAAGALPRPKNVDELGWARIMIHDQGDDLQGRPPVFEGAFSVNGDVYHVTRKENYLRTKHPLDPQILPPLDGGDTKLVVWRDSDTIHDHPATPENCGHDSLAHNSDPMQNPFLQANTDQSISWIDSLSPFGNLTRRQDDGGDLAGPGTMGANFIDTIGDISGCPKSAKVLYMGVAADCRYTATYRNPEEATQQILTNWNTASALYKNTFNISLGIVEVEVQDEACPSTPDPNKAWNVDCNGVNLNQRLSLFSDWRGKRGDDGIGLWHLMSGCPTGSEVGIAWLATVCQMGASGQAGSVVSGTGVSTANRVEWQVIAHEIGHNFGAICSDGCKPNQICCPRSRGSCNANGNFLMSPVASSSGEQVFSDCSIGNICSVMLPGSAGAHTDTTCFVDADQARDTISLQMCGNGIVERDEDCDPGGNSTSPCCDAATCKFINNAVCDPDSSPCCNDQCQFAPSTQVCRPARDDLCDTTEMCSGNSSSCPTDVMQSNGHDCGDGLRCASGICTSNDRQCQIVGAPLRLQKACPNRGDTSCLISCQDPENPNQCRILQSPLIDGSPCGYGGTCNSGSCESGSALDSAKAWYTQNLQIAIPVTIAAAIVLLLLLWAFISACGRCMRGRQNGYQVPLTPGGRMSQRGERGERLPSTYYSAPPGPPPPHPSRLSRGGQPHAGWVDSSGWNGNGR
ncbi:Metallo-peptidase family M12-domain-containing protein [Pterulicium gracile]|uniref:Disintegrin and metalloproteinase domain-containing protein B n=1 Tax=Pterulicium gracile TaxID=1884261 RepID=A0A5C3QZK8_9AGAR|nr:Metallo-peptidase family M12-domain-containing protein [Pterula gracilis]